MAAKIWLVSDTHFGQYNIVHTFKRGDGSPARAFGSVEEMDETMVDRWNKRVKPQDHVWHLGDVAMKRSVLHAMMPRLLGKKRLVGGNHDIFKTADYLRHFDEIKGVRVLADMACTHIPIGTAHFGRRTTANVHGHVHHNTPLVYVRRGDLEAPRLFINVCVETTNYAPIELDEVVALRDAAYKEGLA